MKQKRLNLIDSGENWQFARNLTELSEKRTLLARVAGKQIALFETSSGVLACDNRCPHEGFPLSEGSVSEECVLTCNWHNWKFDLRSGDNLFGGDRLRTYPVELRGGAIWVDVSEPPYDERYTSIVKSLGDAFNDHEYDRIAREITRLKYLGADPLDVLRLAIEWSWKRMEFGWTHAYAGMADWLSLYKEFHNDEEAQLVCLLESTAHAAYDVLREREYPYSDEIISFDESTFLAAVEEENESTAVASIRGGLRDGMQFKNFERALSHAALAHYNDFGHSLIYVTKAGYLIDNLGKQVAEPLLLSLVREIIFASREDKIPEFLHYQTALSKWDASTNTTEKRKKANNAPCAKNWHKLGIKKSLDTTVGFSHAAPETVYRALLEANAISMLSFDVSQQQKIHVPVSGNVGWLDFTHGLTFANAVGKQCARYPELWPKGLLQMACFIGRNAGFTTNDYELEAWHSDDIHSEVGELLQRVFDHGQGEYIVSVHWLKLTLAVREEIQGLPGQTGAPLVAALNRFLNSPLKRRQARRTAYQSIRFVERE